MGMSIIDDHFTELTENRRYKTDNTSVRNVTSQFIFCRRHRPQIGPGDQYTHLVENGTNDIRIEWQLKACAQRFRYALFAFIHTQTYFEYYTLTLRLASLVKRAVIYAYWTKELFDICRENVSHMATLPSVARHVIHADNLGPHH